MWALCTMALSDVYFPQQNVAVLLQYENEPCIGNPKILQVKWILKKFGRPRNKITIHGKNLFIGWKSPHPPKSLLQIMQTPRLSSVHSLQSIKISSGFISSYKLAYKEPSKRPKKTYR